MDPVVFFSSLNAIKKLNASEGPNTNIFEPKFEAREQVQKLIEALENAYAATPSVGALQQLCHCYAFLGTTMMEVEEEEDGYVEARKAYQFAQWCAASITPTEKEVREVQAVPEEDILGHTERGALHVGVENAFAGVREFFAVHNVLGYYLSKMDIDKATAVLEPLEVMYAAWEQWWKEQPEYCAISAVPISDTGDLLLDKVDKKMESAVLQRFGMDCLFTSTLLFLAQVYAGSQDATAVSRCCHLTLYFQLQNKQELDAKDWATNAIQLGAFYSSNFAYDKAYHCLQAGAAMMPVDPREPEESKGTVAWSFGRFYLHRLHHYGGVLQKSEPATSPTAAYFDTYWVEFPGMPPVEGMPPITNFEEARGCFRDGMKALQDALQSRPFESACTDHIDISRDMVQLYGALEDFETNRSRRIAMIQRQIHLLVDLPDQLNFNAYPVVVRQLYYDLGSLYEDQMRLRILQRKNPLSDDKPLADGPFNALVHKALNYFDKFCETWRHPTTQVLPDIVEEESRVPFFRALMRSAHVRLSVAYSNPKLEYDGIGESIKAYQRTLRFAELNEFPESLQASIKREVDTAREMVQLLPMRQREIMEVYQRSRQ